VTENRIISYTEIEIFIKTYFTFLKRKKKLIILLLAISIISSIVYWYLQPDKYSSNSTFLIADQKASNSSIANIATQFGFDLSNMIGGDANMFYGDNVFDILKSNTIIENALHSKYSINKDENKTLLSLYKASKDYSSVYLDYILDTQFNDIINKIKKNHIFIDRTNKKSSILSLTIVSSDPNFSYIFNKELINKTTELYKKLKVGNLGSNIARLEKKADSIQKILNKRSYQSAQLKTIDLNSAYKAESVPIEISDREKIILSSLYTEIIKNIESLKVNLITQTPIFEVLDKPSFPVKNEKPIIFFYLFNGLLIGIMLIGVVFLYPFIKQNKI
jgi:uncharacterized protein involved in exopolysaccharide biosynthesis